MRLTEKELKLFRNNLLAKRAYRNTEVPFGDCIWEPWMEGTLAKLTDELYPQEFDKL
jgi:hypothetical protein